MDFNSIKNRLFAEANYELNASSEIVRSQNEDSIEYRVAIAGIKSGNITPNEQAFIERMIKQFGLYTVKGQWAVWTIKPKATIVLTIPLVALNQIPYQYCTTISKSLCDAIELAVQTKYPYFNVEVYNGPFYRIFFDKEFSPAGAVAHAHMYNDVRELIDELGNSLKSVTSYNNDEVTASFVPFIALSEEQQKEVSKSYFDDELSELKFLVDQDNGKVIAASEELMPIEDSKDGFEATCMISNCLAIKVKNLDQDDVIVKYVIID